MTSNVYLMALVATLCTLAVMRCVQADAFVGGPSSAFVVSRHASNFLVELRGGSTAVEEDEIEFESSDEYESEEEDEEEKVDPKLEKSAVSAAVKAKAKATSAAKSAVNAKLQSKATADAVVSKTKSSSSLLKLLRIPYILRACLNPLVLIQMTKGYFASLVNLNYLNDKVDSSQDLRSALEEKAKKGGPSTGGTRGKRKMKPGQAKTLSDLPQLNT